MAGKKEDKQAGVPGSPSGLLLAAVWDPFFCDLTAKVEHLPRFLAWFLLTALTQDWNVHLGQNLVAL